MRPYLLAVPLGSFLLFLVQPLIGKYILPWFGGSPNVWTTCLLFFQLLLLLGYCYAHLLATWLRPRTQVAVHTALTFAVFLLLPIEPSPTWQHSSGLHPILQILHILFVSVGAPYLILAASAPLLQSWFSLALPDRSPYRLYALSNAASLLALLCYPFAFERFTDSSTQCLLWSATFVLYGMALLACGRPLYKNRRLSESMRNSQASCHALNKATIKKPYPPLDAFLWLSLSCCSTLFLMATTNHLTLDLAPVPLLWILPLSLYLLSFVICFDHSAWYKRDFYTLLFSSSVIAVILQKQLYPECGIEYQLLFTCICQFSLSMCCHGELVLRQPDSRSLTRFYLLIALGGALGGIFAAVVAPLIFDDFHEYWLAILLATALLLLARKGAAIAGFFVPAKLRTILSIAAATVAALALLAYFALRHSENDSTQAELPYKARNFYGVVQVSDTVAGELKFRKMTHGSTLHGLQVLGTEKARTATAYYGLGSGVELALSQHPVRVANHPLRVGIVGLGVGTLAAYANAGDEFVFYEINPLVIDLAQKYFSFINDASGRGAQIALVLGDARLKLADELRSGDQEKFDLLVLDAFSSDSIPIHLLTAECMEIYRERLAKSGILAIHVSNRYLDLTKVIGRHAAEFNADAFLLAHEPPKSELQESYVTSSHWVLIPFGEAALDAIRSLTEASKVSREGPLWTDGFSNIYQLLK